MFATGFGRELEISFGVSVGISEVRQQTRMYVANPILPKSP